ncbi:hypothetical protein B0H17DRAFT_920891, partial [Mycena rosella]
MDASKVPNEHGGGKTKRHVCPICVKGFHHPGGLRTHINMHTGATPFKCVHPGCRRAFKNNFNMRKHFRTH